jgi:hypothetical protein
MLGDNKKTYSKIITENTTQNKQEYKDKIKAQKIFKHI